MYPLKILIVDDVKSIRDYLKTILKPLNSIVYESTNGEDALEQIKNNEFDMVLMDIEMPIMTGIEATYKVRNELQYMYTPIIMITALQNPQLIKSAFDNGATDYISKPLNEIEVLSRINLHFENRRLSLELIASKEAAEQASQHKSDFVSRLAHELKNPLNGIVGLTNLIDMECEKESEDIHEYCRLILEAADFQNELINDVTNLAKIEAGIIDFDVTEVELPSIIKKSFNLIQLMAYKNNITLNFPRLSEVKYIIKTDPKRLKQVFLNLLSNAIKYNKPHGEVRVLIDNKTDNELKIGISDTGYGINKANIPKLFEVFNRLGAESTEIEGSGIGLPISRKIIELMGGRLEVESIIDEGSTFWIVLTEFKKMNVQPE
ncbi:MAG: hybrid sensor histidine kinase/response regulator [Gammaproteobacteria bacterium]|nr:hybrid sensor histidine kinase/response regulator [Gammaproteobacteria bacterium]